MTQANQEGGLSGETAGAAAAGLRWTRHPLVDMGIATLTAFSERQRPGDVTAGDLEAFAGYLDGALDVVAVRSHASVLFTQNTPYLQPSFTEDQRRANARLLFRASRAFPPAEDAPACIYCGRPAALLRTKTHRAYRELIPLLTGQGTVNFAPYGEHGLAICGLCVVALQALVLGAPSCEGRAVIIGADDPQQLVDLVAAWLPRVQSRIQLSRVSGAKVDPWKAPRTRLVDQLIALTHHQRAAVTPTSFTLYHASNSGQGPSLEVYVLGAPLVAFVERAQTTRYLAGWRALERRAWRDSKGKPDEHVPDVEERLRWRNSLYEDLFGLPERARAFVERWLLAPQRASLEDAQATQHTPLWEITRLFLEEVLGVDGSRIQAIQDLGDALAREIAEQNDRRLFRQALRATRYPTIRRELLRLSERRTSRGEPPVLTFQGFLAVFEEGEDVERHDWRLAWDLTLIRMVDTLHEQGWLARNRDAAQEAAEAAAAEAEDDETTDRLPAGLPG